jgi:hypothetical protein
MIMVSYIRAATNGIGRRMRPPASYALMKDELL